MKKILYIITVSLLCAFTACNSNDNESPIEISNIEDLNQVFYASKSDGSIAFNTNDLWTASIKESQAFDTESTAPKWVKLNKYSGPAGSYTVAIEVDDNFTGTSRYAVITITCAGETVTVKITQDGKTENGNIHKKNISRILFSKTADDDHAAFSSVLSFTYDLQGRLSKIHSKGDGEEYSFEKKGNITYSDKAVRFETTSYFNGGFADRYITEAKLNDKGYIVSGKSIEEIESGERVIERNVQYDNRDFISSIEEIYDDKTWVTTFIATENLEQIKVRNKYTSEAKYTTHLNNGVLDINWIIYDDEWFSMMDAGVFDLIGLYGKRSKNLVESTHSWEGEDFNEQFYNHSYTFDEDGFLSEWVTGNQTYKVEY